MSDKRMMELNSFLNESTNDDVEGISKIAGKIVGTINNYRPKTDGKTITVTLKKKGIKQIKSHPINVSFVIDDDKKNIKKWESKIKLAMNSEFGKDYKYDLKIW